VYKPRPEIYQLACDRMQADPTEVRFVAGAAYDARGAAAAGLDAVLVMRRSLKGPPLPVEIRAVGSLQEAVAVP
jgi:2-haloacid dehalogenase